MKNDRRLAVNKSIVKRVIDHESKLSYSRIVYKNVSRRVLQMEPKGGQIFETQNKAFARFDISSDTLYLYLDGGLVLRRDKFHCDPVPTS